jgi:hypothetical protein
MYFISVLILTGTSYVLHFIGLSYSRFLNFWNFCARTFSIYKQIDRSWVFSLADVSAVIASNNSLHSDSFLFPNGIELPRDNAILPQ